MKIPVVYWLSSSVVAVIGCAVMAAGYVQMQKQVDGISETFAISDITSIHADLSHSAVQIISSETAELVTVELKHAPSTVSLSSGDGTLFIKDPAWSEMHLFSFGNVNGQIGEIVITVPTETLQEIVLSVGFGSENVISDVQTDRLTIESGAGNWTINQTQASTLSMDTGAGNTELNNCTFGTFTYSQGAGNLTGSGCTIQRTAEIESGAGNCVLDVCKFAGDVTFDTGMGDLELNDLRLSGDLDISCGAGNVTIGILGDAHDYTVDCSDHVGNVSIQGNHGTAYTDGDIYRITIDGVGNADVIFHD